MKHVRGIAAFVAAFGFATSAFAGGGGDHHHAPYESLFFWGQFINFILLALLFFKFALPALNKFFAERRQTIAADLEEAQRLKKEAEQTFSEYEGKLDKLDEELETLRTDFIKAGEVERDRIVGEAETKAARLRKDSQFIVDQRGKQLVLDLRREAAEATVAAAKKALQERLTQDDHRRLAEDFLKDLSSNGKQQTTEVAKAATRTRGTV